MIDQLPPHVVVALDHVTPAEREGVLAAISAFARREREGVALPHAESFHLLWAAPDLRVIVRRTGPHEQVKVEDVVRPATLRAFAAANVS